MILVCVLKMPSPPLAGVLRASLITGRWSQLFTKMASAQGWLNILTTWQLTSLLTNKRGQNRSHNVCYDLVSEVRGHSCQLDFFTVAIEYLAEII